MLVPTRLEAVVGQTLAARGAPGARPTVRWPAIVAAALLSLGLALALSQSVGSGRSTASAHALRPNHARKDLSSLPITAQGPISAALGADDGAYHVTSSGGVLRATNPAQRLSTRFARSGVAVSAGAARVSVRASAIGFGTSLRALGEASPQVHTNRVVYSYPGLQEWYTNGPAGLEQGFTVQRAPRADDGGPLTISMALSGNVRATPAASGNGITLSRAGLPALHYAGLSATDATGRALHGRIELHDGQISLSIDARGARYPLHVDPFFQQGEKLVGTGTVGTAFQGFSVALSGENGNTALIGGPEDLGNTGAAWVFTRSGTTWTQQAKLTASEQIGHAELGSSVALSGSGNTALLGGPNDNGNVGATWVFTRSGEKWTQQAKLVGTGSEGESEQGTSVALSTEGTTAVIGGDGDDGNIGAAWVFTLSGEKWTQQGAKLVGVGTEGAPAEGSSVAVSAEGTTATALIGGPEDDEHIGATWVFARSATGEWTQQGEKLVGTGNTGASQQGFSVALASKGGNFAIVGAPEDNSGAGAAWIFTRSGEKWTQQGSKLVGTGATGSAQQGHSVAISSEGTTALIGGPADNTNAGAAWVFTRSGEKWTQQGSKLTGTGATGKPRQGVSVALASAGTTALIGGPEDNSNMGAGWVFTRSGEKWTQQGSKLVGSGALGDAFQGFSVALSSEGTTALVGGPTDAGAAGAAWVFTRSGEKWTQQAKLTGTGATGMAAQGFSVALAANGNTALVGGPLDNSAAGAVWVFTRSGEKWTQQGSKLTGSGATGAAQQGFSVALSSEGSTALIGGLEDNSDVGAAWVFTRSSEKWTQQGSKLVGSGNTGSSEQGYDVALSGEGNTALIGGPSDNEFKGAAWVFTRSSEKWTQQGSKLVGSGAVGIAQQGISVALSSEGGNTALIGGPSDSEFAGATWVFTRSGTIWTQQGSKLVGSGAQGPAEQGHDVALSANGNTALIGGPNDNSSAGATWVFVRTGTNWSQQGSKLVGTGAAGPAQQGSAVALATNGSTALIGGPEDNGGAGAVWPFTFTLVAPTVTSVSPNESAEAGGGTVTITGTSFNGATAVKFGTTEAKKFKVESETSITAEAPAGTGGVDVRVTTSGGTSATGPGDKFTYVAPPTVTSLAPKEGSNAGGTNVTITGTKLSGASVVKFGTVETKNFKIESETSIVVVSPPGSTGTVDVTVTTLGGTSAIVAGDKFTYVNTPAVTSVSPNEGEPGGGTPVTITGTNLTGATAVKFGTTEAKKFKVESETSITAEAPAGTGSVDVRVTTPSGTSPISAGDTFTWVGPRVFSLAFGNSGQLRSPHATAVDSSGDVWVADTANNRIEEFSESGELLRQVGTAGSEPGQLSSPQGIAIDPKGNIWVLDTGNYRVQEFSATGTFMRQVGSKGAAAGQFEGPSGIATDSKGDVWVSDGSLFSGVDRIEEFSETGTFVREFGAKGSEPGQLLLPAGLAVDSKGDVWVADSLNARIEEFSETGTFMAAFGSRGSATGQLQLPEDVAVDSKGNVWVADTQNNRIQEFSGTGTSLASLGSFGSGNGQLSSPWGLALTSSGSVWVADTQNNRVQLLGSKGEFIRVAGASNAAGQLSSPHGAATDSKGDVWVADTANDRIQEFSEAGTFIRQFGAAGSEPGQLSSPQGVAIDSKGDVWVADTGNFRVQEFSETGTLIRQVGTFGSEPGQFSSPQGIAIDAKGNVWVSDGNLFSASERVEEFSEAGTFVRQFGEKGSGPGQMLLPAGIAVDAKGHVWIADSVNARVDEFSETGTLISSFGTRGSESGQLDLPQGLGVDSKGDVWVADTGNNRVQEFSEGGTPMAILGSAGSGSGQLSSPAGLALETPGKVLIVDTGNNRVQKWVPS